MKKILSLIVILFIIFNIKSQSNNSQKLIDSIAIVFQFDDSKIDNSEYYLSKIAVLSQNGIASLKIIAYTDTVGTISYNEKLAENRMDNVLLLLGKTKLIETPTILFNKNEERNSRNTIDSLFRRVDILFFDNIIQIKDTQKVVVPRTPTPLSIQFIGGTDILLDSSFPGLIKLKKTIESNINIKIELHGHVCCNPDQELSNKRALRVKRYLIENKIDENRISCKGFSNTKNLVPDNTEINHSINRRVEVVFY